MPGTVKLRVQGFGGLVPVLGMHSRSFRGFEEALERGILGTSWLEVEV